MSETMQKVWAAIAISAIVVIGLVGYGLVQSNKDLAATNSRIATQSSRQADAAEDQASAVEEQANAACIESYKQDSTYHDLAVTSPLRGMIEWDAFRACL